MTQRGITSGLRGVLFTGLLAVLLIAGILGMHTLSTGHSPASAALGAASASAAHGGAAPAESRAGAASAALASASHDGSAPAVPVMQAAAPSAHAPDGLGQEPSDHGMQDLLCVLALLLSLVLVAVMVRPAPLRRWTERVTRRAAGVRCAGVRPPPQPSLIVLSISRT